MFAAYGIKAVRMDDIAHELGVSKRTLYELFGDKETLLYEAMMHLFSSKREEHVRIAEGADNILEAMFMVLSRIMQEAPLHTRLTTNLQKFYPEVFRRVKEQGVEQNYRGLRKLIEEGIAQGFFVDWMDIDLTIAIFCGAARSLKGSDDKIAIPQGMSEVKVFRQIVPPLFRGIGTDKGRELIDCYAGHYLNNESE